MSAPLDDTARGAVVAARRSPHGLGHRCARALWNIVEATLFRLSPRPCHGWRRLLLRLFGARLASTAQVYPQVRIWAPWNLRMDELSTIADGTIVYAVAPITIGAGTTVSQYGHLCAATHDHEDPTLPLIPKPITIGPRCWIAAEVFVGPGVTIGEGSVVGARSTVLHDLPAWKVCVGTPAKPVRDRVLRER